MISNQNGLRVQDETPILGTKHRTRITGVGPAFLSLHSSMPYSKRDAQEHGARPTTRLEGGRSGTDHSIKVMCIAFVLVK